MPLKNDSVALAEFVLAVGQDGASADGSKRASVVFGRALKSASIGMTYRANTG
jgi:hypothetical protein